MRNRRNEKRSPEGGKFGRLYTAGKPWQLLSCQLLLAVVGWTDAAIHVVGEVGESLIYQSRREKPGGRGFGRMRAKHSSHTSHILHVLLVVWFVAGTDDGLLAFQGWLMLELVAS